MSEIKKQPEPPMEGDIYMGEMPTESGLPVYVWNRDNKPVFSFSFHALKFEPTPANMGVMRFDKCKDELWKT